MPGTFFPQRIFNNLFPEPFHFNAFFHKTFLEPKIRSSFPKKNFRELFWQLSKYLPIVIVVITRPIPAKAKAPRAQGLV